MDLVDQPDRATPDVNRAIVRIVRHVALLLSLWVHFSVLPARADPVDDLAAAMLRRDAVPGFAVAITRHGEVVATRAYGTTHLELGSPVTTDTVFEIGSMTKQFTAAAVMMLVEAGRIGLDDRLERFVPTVPDAWRPVTVRELLTHTSGIPSFTDLPDFEKSNPFDATPAEVIRSVSARPLDFRPGTRWSYNNTAFFLLGLVIEKASGRPYGEFLEERIFRPLGMSSTRLNDRREVIPRRATGYVRENGRYEHAPYESSTWPWSGGALLSTAGDLAKWDLALRDARILPSPALARMWTPVDLADGTPYPYGFGWHLEDFRGHRETWHTGHIDGFSAVIARFPEEDLSVIVLANLASAPAHAFARRLAAVYEPALMPPGGPTTTADPHPESGERLRQLLREAAGGSELPSVATPGLRYVLTAQARAAARRLVGSLTSLHYIGHDDIAASRPLSYLGSPIARIDYYRTESADGATLFRCYIAPDGRIAQLWPEPD